MDTSDLPPLPRPREPYDVVLSKTTQCPYDNYVECLQAGETVDFCKRRVLNCHPGELTTAGVTVDFDARQCVDEPICLCARAQGAITFYGVTVVDGDETCLHVSDFDYDGPFKGQAEAGIEEKLDEYDWLFCLPSSCLNRHRAGSARCVGSAQHKALYTDYEFSYSANMATAEELARAAPLGKPRICCLDLDTFFVSVERLLDPSLEGQPVVIGGKPGTRGVVTAASYEVRRLGVKSGLSLIEAGKLAPNAIYLPTRGEIYSQYAERVREIARCFTPEVVVASIDEMFLDLSGCEGLHSAPDDERDDLAIERAVLALTAEIDAELGLPASAGIATSRTMAKIASNLAKPRGVMLVPAGVERAVLAPLPVRALPGVGPVGEARLRAAGYETLGELAAAPLVVLEEIFGAWARALQKSARGESSGRVGRERPTFSEYDPEGEAVGSISNERTFHADASDDATIESVLCGLCERVCWRARKRAVKARTVTLKLRYSDFHTITRSRTLSPTCSEFELYPVVKELLRLARIRSLPVRLLGIQISNLGVFEQLDLFTDYKKIGTVVDGIRERYGFSMITLGTQQGGAGKTLVGRRSVGRS